jgi:Tfp pilus assembly protein FimT
MSDRHPHYISFHSSHYRSRLGEAGFTLIELVVIIALLGIVMFISVPNFQHLLSDNVRKTSQWILLQVPKFRSKATSETLTCSLHVDMSDQRLWFTNSRMTEEEYLAAVEQGLKLDDTIRLLDVVYSYGESIHSGEAVINFYAQGYSDRAILHLEDGYGDVRSFIFEPFLTQVEIIEGYADFEE